MLKDFDSKRCPLFVPDMKFEACTSFDPATNPLECGFCKHNDKYYRCIAHNGVIPLSHSMVQDFLTCHHLCYLVSLRGIQVNDPAKSPPLKMGSLWDAVIGDMYGGVDKDTGQKYDIPGLIKRLEMSPFDVAKVRGLFRAYKLLEIEVEPGGVVQKKINLKLDFGSVWGNGMPVEIMVTGYYDRWYPNGTFVENKLTGKPDYYQDPYFIQSQIGTYFLADDTLQEVVMEITRTPDLKSTKANEGEDADTYGERVYQDVIKRPSHYFIGWNPSTRRYGKKFYRKEFAIEEIRSRFIHIFREYWECRQFDGWYKNDRACAQILPGIPCGMKPLCRNNNMSESIYHIRQRPITF